MIDKDRWAKVERIYHAALEHEPEERAAFVSNECAGDHELENEVGSLLKFDGQSDAFMQTSALNVAAKTLAASQQTSEDEPKIEDIGPYHLLKLIGEGGTGNVYLAVDTRLDRKVAIKILTVDFTFSPDEQQVVVALNDPEVDTRDLWILSRAKGEPRRLTSDPADEMNPIWSPDGRWIYFTANKNGARNIYRVLARGNGPIESVLASNEDLNLEDISSNGRLLVFNFRNKGDDVPGVGLLSLPDKRRVVFASAPARSARLSPDQKWMAYTSTRSGSEIVVRRVGAGGLPAGDEQVVSGRSGSATTAMWRADGKELFWLEGGMLMSVQIETNGARLIAGEPRSLCRLNVEDQERRNRYLVSKDGLFLVILKSTAN